MAAAAGNCCAAGSARQARPASGSSSADPRKAADMTRSRWAAFSQPRIHKSDKPTQTGPGQHLRQLHQLGVDARAQPAGRRR